MADDKPQVVVQYVTKSDAAPAPSCAEMIAMAIILAAMALAFGWLR